MSEREEEINKQIVEEWFRHPVTRQVADGLTDEMRKALTNLVGAARNSTDASVREAVTKYDALARFAKTVMGDEA